MRYAKIDACDICNGLDVGCSLYVQGCPIHCHGCFNSQTWDFNGGEPFTQEIKDKFFDIVNHPYIKRVSILGGEPLADNNVGDVTKLLRELRARFNNTKKIWVFTGYEFEKLPYEAIEAISMADYLVDSPFKIAYKDISLAFRGSSNQRIIDIVKSVKDGKLVLWNGAGSRE